MNIKTYLNNIESLPTNKEKGDVFEKLCHAILSTHPEYTRRYDSVWLYSDIPSTISKKLKLPKIDKGLDAIAKLKDTNSFIGIQMKFRTNIENTIPWNELSTFVGSLFSDKKVFHGGLFMTNQYQVCSEVTDKGVGTFCYQEFMNLSDYHFQLALKYLHKDSSTISVPKRLPFQHQIEALEALDKHYIYKNKDRGILTMSPGSGKTFTSFSFFEKHYTRAVVFVPSLLLLSQIYNEWLSDKQTNIPHILLIGSRATDDQGKPIPTDIEIENKLLLHTDPKIISNHLLKTKDEPIWIFVTYQSACQLLKSIQITDEIIQFDLAIYDEAHKTCGISSENGLGFSLSLSDDFPFKKRLYCTATPKVYYGYDLDSDSDSDSHSDSDFDPDLHSDSDSESNAINDDANSDHHSKNVRSMHNKKIYGSIIYELKIFESIKRGILSDYQISIPLVEVDIVNKMIAENRKLNFEDIKCTSQEISSAMVLMACIRETGCRKILTYHNSIKSATNYQAILTIIFKALDIDFVLLHMNGSQSSKKQQMIMHEFKNSELSILSTARCLNEGVDIPSVDAVVFVDPSKSTIDIIQRIGRGLRKNSGKIISNVIIPVVFDKKEDDFEDTAPVGWDHVWNILKAMNTEDERILQYFVQKKECGGGNAGHDISSSQYQIIRELTGVMQEFCREIIGIPWLQNISRQIRKICVGNVDDWMLKLEKVKHLIDTNKKKPSACEKY
jgi:predicted helicase